MGCQASLDLSPGILLPTFYWPMTSIVGGVSPATIGGNDLVMGKMSGFPATFSAGGSEVIVPGGLFTNAMSFPSTSWPVAADAARSTTPLNIPNTNDFSIRIWVKDPVFGGAGNFDVQCNSVGIQNTHAGTNAVATEADQFYMHQPNPPAYVETQLDYSVNDPLNLTWTRVVLTWTNATKTMLAKINNTPSVTMVNATGSWMSVTYFITLGINGFAMNLCECGVWANHALTEAEMLLDWNGGAGKTYP